MSERQRPIWGEFLCAGTSAVMAICFTNPNPKSFSYTYAKCFTYTYAKCFPYTNPKCFPYTYTESILYSNA